MAGGKEKPHQNDLEERYKGLPALDDSCLVSSVCDHEQADFLQHELVDSILGLGESSFEPSTLLRAKDVLGERGLSAKDKLNRLPAKLGGSEAEKLLLIGLNSLAHDYPDLSFWRGGSYILPTLMGDFALSLPIALYNLPCISRSAGLENSTPRELPALIRIPLDVEREDLLGNVRVVGLAGGLSSVSYELTLEVNSCRELGIDFYRPPDNAIGDLRSFVETKVRKARLKPLFEGKK